MTSALAFRIERSSGKVLVNMYRPEENRTTRIIAQDVILACPRYLTKVLFAGTELSSDPFVASFSTLPGWLLI
jgi:hypothetical protein